MNIGKFRKLFGKNIRYFRKKKNLTIEQLADLADINPKYLGGVERGVYNISFDNIIRLSNALKIEPHLLFIFPKSSFDEQFSKTISLISSDTPEMLKFYNKIISDIKEFLKNKTDI